VWTDVARGVAPLGKWFAVPWLAVTVALLLVRSHDERPLDAHATMAWSSVHRYVHSLTWLHKTNVRALGATPSGVAPELTLAPCPSRCPPDALPMPSRELRTLSWQETWRDADGSAWRGHGASKA